MFDFLFYLKSDFYKLKHSWFFQTHFIFIFFGISLISLYSKFSSTNELSKLLAFFQLVAIAFPFAISIVTQILADQESNAGNFQNLLTLTYRRKAILSKFVILILTGLIFVLFMTLSYGIFFSMLFDFTIPIQFYFVMPLVLWSSNIMLYGIHLIIAFRFGRNVGISVGVFGSLLIALLQTGLGTGIWYVLPYGPSIHFVEDSLMHVFHLSSNISTEILIGRNYCLVSTCLIIGYMLFWFNRYSGNLNE